MTPVVGEPKRSLVMLVPPNPGYGQADERQVPPPKKTVGVRQRSGSARCGLKRLQDRHTSFEAMWDGVSLDGRPGCQRIN